MKPDIQDGVSQLKFFSLTDYIRNSEQNIRRNYQGLLKLNKSRQIVKDNQNLEKWLMGRV